MEKDLKQLLLKDLCARLPYDVKGLYYSTVMSLHMVDPFDNYHSLYCVTKSGSEYIGIDEFKPYLFPMSSMTEEQKEELQKLRWNFDGDDISNSESYYSEHTDYVTHFECYSLIDWLNKNHFDYRGLIPMGLAKDATGLNIY